MITRDAPLLSAKQLSIIVAATLPKQLNRECNQFDVGYETAKAELAAVIGKQLGYSLDASPARQLYLNLKGG